MTTFRHSSLIVAIGTFRPVMREDLERSARDDLEDPVLPYSHLKATLTSWKPLLDVWVPQKMRSWKLHAIFYDKCCQRGDQERSAHLGPAVGRALWHLGDRLRGDKERYAHLSSVEKGLRRHQCDQLHGDWECFTHPVPVVKSLRLQQRDRLHGDWECFAHPVAVVKSLRW